MTLWDHMWGFTGCQRVGTGVDCYGQSMVHGAITHRTPGGDRGNVLRNDGRLIGRVLYMRHYKPLRGWKALTTSVRTQ